MTPLILIPLALASAETGIDPAAVGTIITALILGLGGAGYGVTQRIKRETRITPQPLEVKNADTHYVTREEHREDIERINRTLTENAKQLNQLTGTVNIWIQSRLHER